MTEHCPTCGTQLYANGCRQMTDVVNAVSDVTGVSIEDMKGPRRHYDRTYARHIAVLLMREYCRDKSLPEIGRFFGNRDHTTIMYGAKRAEELIRTDERAKDIYERAKHRLGL